MRDKSGLTLRALQWFVRGVQFLSCAVVLALFSYFLAIAAQHHYDIPTWAKAVEGISGVGVIYTFLGLLFLCCLAGHPFTSSVAILLDILFIGAFIYVAQANREGANSCTNTVNTLFGTHPASYNLGEGLPNFRQLCQMQKAVLAVSIIAIVFFLLSAFIEVILVRHRRKVSHLGPSPGNNYTSGSAQKGGFFSRFGRRKAPGHDGMSNPNSLPAHTHPSQVRTSYNTETTACGPEGPYNKYGESGFQHEGQTAYPEGTTHPTAGQTVGNDTYVR